MLELSYGQLYSQLSYTDKEFWRPPSTVPADATFSVDKGSGIDTMLSDGIKLSEQQLMQGMHGYHLHQHHLHHHQQQQSCIEPAMSDEQNYSVDRLQLSEDHLRRSITPLDRAAYLHLRRKYCAEHVFPDLFEKLGGCYSSPPPRSADVADPLPTAADTVGASGFGCICDAATTDSGSSVEEVEDPSRGNMPPATAWAATASKQNGQWPLSGQTHKQPWGDTVRWLISHLLL